jgi:hypothetical protein
MARFGFGWFSLDRGRTHPMGDLGAARGSTVYIPPPSKKSEIPVESVSEYFFSKTKRVFLYI